MFGYGPNIKGSFGVRCYIDYGHSGAFLSWKDSEENQAKGRLADTNGPVRVLPFDASASSSIYSGSTVQQKGIQVLACLKF